MPLLLALAGAILLARRRRALVLAPPEWALRADARWPPDRADLADGRPPCGAAGARPSRLRAAGSRRRCSRACSPRPIYHLGTGNPSGDQKHVVFGLIFILPLAGVALERAFAGRRRWLAATLLTLGLALFACVQVVRIDESWPDLRASASVLSADVHPGERLLVNSAWVEDVYLYSRGRIDTPYDLYDVYRVEHLGRPVDVCDFQWFVVVPGGEAWPAAVREQMLRCGSFREIYTARATLTNLGRNLRFVTYTEPIEIWRNERERTSGSSRPRARGEGRPRSRVGGQYDRNGK